MQSPFLYLHNRKQTRQLDSQKYESANSNLYRKQAWKFCYACLLCKLYDMSSLPIRKGQKAYIYGGLVMSLSTISFYRSSLPLVQMLERFDKQYEDQYKKFVSETGFQGIAS